MEQHVSEMGCPISPVMSGLKPKSQIRSGEDGVEGLSRVSQGRINYLGRAFAHHHEKIAVSCLRCHTDPHWPLGHPTTSGVRGFASKPSGQLRRSRKRPDHLAAHAANVATPRRVSLPPSWTQVSRFRTHHNSAAAARRIRTCARRIAAVAVGLSVILG